MPVDQTRAVERSFRARVIGHAEDGARGLAAKVAVPILFVLLAVIRTTTDFGAHNWGWMFLFGAVFGLALGLWRARRRVRDAVVEVGAGFVDIYSKVRAVRGRVVGRKLKGATTSNFGNQKVICLGGAKNALSLEIDRDADVAAVRQALGIGHHGYGRVTWCTQPPKGHEYFRILMWLALAGSSITNVLLFGFIVFLLAEFFGYRGGKATGALVTLHDWGVETLAAKIPYREITHIATQKGHLQLYLRSGRTWPIFTGSLPPHEVSVLYAQLQDASARANGLVVPAPVVADEIARLGTKDEDASRWLAELDADAQRMLKAAGYRGGGGVMEEDLWEVLENHDATPDVRAAVARVLIRASKAPDAAERIERVAASAREEKTERLIRIATQPDTDEAVRELEAEREAEERKAKRARTS